jgi:hypothetical protein
MNNKINTKKIIKYTYMTVCLVEYFNDSVSDIHNLNNKMPFVYISSMVRY